MEKISSVVSKISANAPFIFEILLNIAAALFILIIGWLLAKIIRKRLRTPVLDPKILTKPLGQ